MELAGQKPRGKRISECVFNCCLNRTTTTGQIWWELHGVGSAAGPDFEIFPWPVSYTYGNCVAASNLTGNNNTRLVMEPCDGSAGRVFRLG